MVLPKMKTPAALALADCEMVVSRHSLGPLTAPLSIFHTVPVNISVTLFNLVVKFHFKAFDWSGTFASVWDQKMT